MDIFTFNHLFNFYKPLIARGLHKEKNLHLPAFICPPRTQITAISHFNYVIYYFQILYSPGNITILKLCNLVNTPQHFFLKPAENNSTLYRGRCKLPVPVRAQNEDSYYRFEKQKINVCKQSYKVTELNLSRVTKHSVVAQKYQNRHQHV